MARVVMHRRGFVAALRSLASAASVFPEGARLRSLLRERPPSGQWFTIMDADTVAREAGLQPRLSDAALVRIDRRVAETFDMEFGREPTPGAGGGVRLQRRRLFGPPLGAPALPPAPAPRRRLFGPPAPDGPAPAPAPAPAPDDLPAPAPAPDDLPARAPDDLPARAPVVWKTLRNLRYWKKIAQRRRRTVRQLRHARAMEKKKLENVQAELAR